MSNLHVLTELGWDGKSFEKTAVKPPRVMSHRGFVEKTPPKPKQLGNSLACTRVLATRASSIGEDELVEASCKSVIDNELESPEDRARRVKWIDYYVRIGEQEKARSLGWDGSGLATQNVGGVQPPVHALAPLSVGASGTAGPPDSAPTTPSPKTPKKHSDYTIGMSIMPPARAPSPANPAVSPRSQSSKRVFRGREIAHSHRI